MSYPNQMDRKLSYRGTLTLPKSLRSFSSAMPLHAELDRMVRSGHPELVLHKNAGPIRCGDLLVYPERNRPLPPLFEYIDTQTGTKYCLDTRKYSRTPGIALFLPRGSFRFRFDGNRMIFFMDRDPVVLPFPQDPGWYPYDPSTFIPVSTGGVTDSGSITAGRFLRRGDGPWIGCPTRSVNMGNNEEGYVYVFERPSLPRGVFVWESQPQKPAPNESSVGSGQPRRVVQVPASAPIQRSSGLEKRQGADYFSFVREWNIRRTLHSLDPARYSDPGPAPDKETFEKLLREGKIGMENKATS